MTGRRLAAVVLSAALAGCAQPAPAPTPSPPSGVALPDPGQPFGAAAILAAMRDSRRPGGVADELQTDAVATAVAARIWTFDGRPWATMAASGACGPERCALELAGARADSEAEDVWVFELSRLRGDLEFVTAELRAMPSQVVDDLDALARALRPTELEGMILGSARWLPPPEAGRVVLAYRGGGEEGACGLDLTIEAAAARVVVEEPAC